MNDTTVRASFAMTRVARESIKAAAKRYDMAQGEVVDLLPLLLGVVAERSLADRTERLEAINALVEQAARSLEAIVELAPHMGPLTTHVVDVVRALPRTEEHAIANGRLYGLDKADYEATGFGDIHDQYLPYAFLMGNADMKSPIMETIRKIATDGGAKITTGGGHESAGFIEFSRPGSKPIFSRIAGGPRGVSFECPTVDFVSAYEQSNDLPDSEDEDEKP